MPGRLGAVRAPTGEEHPGWRVTRSARAKIWCMSATERPSGQQQTGRPAANPCADSAFLRACRREPVPHTPVWFMRQAGRVLPEYRKVRESLTLLQISERPEVCAEVTLQPLRRIDYDAAILFADIMTPLVGIGVRLDIVDGVGPVIEQPVRTPEAAGSLRAI